MSYAHIIEVFLHVDRPPHPKFTTTMTEDFVRYRNEFFRKYTLKSIQEQTAQEFQVFLQTGETWGHLVEAETWPENVKVCRHWGEREYLALDADFVVITRIDSDDLFHRTAIAEVKRVAEMYLDPSKRVTLAFKKRLCWSMQNGFITRHDKPTSSCYTHIFPKAIYHNWPLFMEQHFTTHGKSGDVYGVKLPDDLMCIVKHEHNWSNVKQGIAISPADDAWLRKYRVKPGYIFDPAKVKTILRDFGVEL